MRQQIGRHMPPTHIFCLVHTCGQCSVLPREHCDFVMHDFAVYTRFNSTPLLCYRCRGRPVISVIMFKGYKIYNLNRGPVPRLQAQSEPVVSASLSQKSAMQLHRVVVDEDIPTDWSESLSPNPEVLICHLRERKLLLWKRAKQI